MVRQWWRVQKCSGPRLLQEARNTMGAKCTIFPQQNGVSERLNRTLMERVRCLVRCLLYETKLNKKLWNEAATTVIYLKNRSPTNGISTGTTPYELWFGKKPNLDHIRIFGSKCYVQVPDTTSKKKLNARKTKGYLVGYEASNIYRVWCPKNRCTLRIRDVTIDESIVGIQNATERSSTPHTEIDWSDSDSDSTGEITEDEAQQESDSDPGGEVSEHEVQQESELESDPELPEPEPQQLKQ